MNFWERPDCWFGKPWEGWYVAYARHRDSDPITECNYEIFLDKLKSLAKDVLVDDTANAEQSYRTNEEDWTETETVFVVRESHWAVGWVEYIVVHPSNEKAVQLADKMLCDLEAYPILDDDLLTELEDEQIESWWEGMSIRERVEWCQDNEDSIFAARHDYPPMNTHYALREALYS